MSSYSFYQISKSSLEKVLPNLLFKIYSSLKKPMMLLVAEQDVAKYDDLFWSFSTNKFLPHGTLADSEAHYQYLLISCEAKNINKAEILVAVNEVADDFAKDFKKVIYVFSANHPDIVKFKARYNTEKQQKPKNTLFWQQDEKGNWANS